MNFINVLKYSDKYCKQKHYKRPKYKIVFIDGNVYRKLYEISVEINGVLRVTETGISRRIAKKKAAFKAINQLKLLNNEVFDNEDNKLGLDENDLVPTPEEAIHRLRELEDMLRKKQEYLESIQNQEIDIIKKNDNKNKRVSLQALKRKERIDKQMDQIKGTLATIKSQRKALENANINTEMLNIMTKKIDNNSAEDMDEINEQQITNNKSQTSNFISIDNDNLIERQFNNFDTNNDQGSIEHFYDIINGEEDVDISYEDTNPKSDIEEKSESRKSLLNSMPNVVKVENDLKPNNENPDQNNSTPNNTPNKLKNEFIDQNHSSYDLEIDPINDLFKCCLRKSIHFPVYDFDFNDDMFCAKCRIQINGTEYVGFGKSKTLKVAKTNATQEVIDELKSKNLYFDYNPNEIQLEENDYNWSSGFNQRFENKFKEYSKVTINMTSTETKNIGTKAENIPILKDLEDSEDESGDKNVVTFKPTPEEAIQRLQEVEGILRKKQDILEKKRMEMIKIIRKNGSKNNLVSLQTLEDKNRFDKQLEQIEAKLSKIKYKRRDIQNLIINKEVVQIMIETDQIIEQINNYNDIEFETLMDEIREQQQIAEEINQIISNSNGNMSEIYNDSHSSTFISRDNINSPPEEGVNNL